MRTQVNIIEYDANIQAIRDLCADILLQEQRNDADQEVNAIYVDSMDVEEAVVRISSLGYHTDEDADKHADTDEEYPDETESEATESEEDMALSPDLMKLLEMPGSVVRTSDRRYAIVRGDLGEFSLYTRNALFEEGFLDGHNFNRNRYDLSSMRLTFLASRMKANGGYPSLADFS